MSENANRWTQYISTPDQWRRDHREAQSVRKHREEMERIDDLLDVLGFIPLVDLRANVERSKAY